MKGLILVGLTMLLNGHSYADDKHQDNMHASSGKMSEMTTEQREKMAKAHEQMAICLRSSKDVQACHEEMMTSCKANNACHAMMEHHKGAGKKK